MPSFLSAITAGALTTSGTVTANGNAIVTPDVLTDASTVSVNAALGNHFRLLMTSGVGATRTIGAPSNPTDGQLIMFELQQDATGSRLAPFASGTGGYVWGTTVAVPTLSTGASKTDYVGFIYNATANVWRGIAVALGY